MYRSTIKLVLLLVTLAVSCISIAQAADDKGPPHAMISIYHIAPGKHMEFLKWLAAREAVDKEVGVPATQVYAHIDGDSWDYLSVGPMTTPEQDKQVEAAMKKHGLTTGFKASLEIRQFLASHTDTFVVGPVTASELVEQAMK
jgi:hypothetical protein